VNKLYVVIFIVALISITSTLTKKKQETMNDKDCDFAREQMVVLLKEEGIKDENVLAVMLKVPRHAFVKSGVEEEAYVNTALPIDCSQTISQPYIVAFMTEAAQLNSNSKVLEIGTGSGYQAAILGEICKEVFTVEIIEELANKAANLLEKLSYRNVYVKFSNGYKGWPEKAPFDAIIVTAASKTLPIELVEQLSIGGRMIIPLESEAGRQILVRVIKTSQDNDYRLEDLLDVRFVPMVSSSN